MRAGWTPWSIASHMARIGKRPAADNSGNILRVYYAVAYFGEQRKAKKLRRSGAGVF